MEPTIEQQIADKAHAIVKDQIGDLVLSCAKFRAENDVLRAEVARLTAPPQESPRESS
jgi:hypothetical protein